MQQAVTSLISPHILDLPVEIITHIFHDCLPVAPAYNELSDAPLLLTRICKIWRSIALNTQQLWTSIIVDSHRPPHTGVVEAWLRRAGDKGLTVELTHQEDEVGDEDYDERLQALEVQDLFTPVMSWSHQWMDVTINLSPAVCENYFRTRRTFPMLRKLSINSNFFRSEIDPPIEALRMFSDAPVLTEVDMAEGIPFTAFELPWGQLTTFYSCMQRVEDCAKVLSLASHLATCELLDVVEGPRPSSHNPLLYLQNFTLETSAGDPIPPFLLNPLHFPMPALRHLKLTTIPTTVEDMSWFLSMLANASHLQTFDRICGSPGIGGSGEDRIVSCLAAARPVTDLSYEDNRS
ncbi:hypothetical protein C8J57DRAFT_1643192 [Mycena rebaudengoi]|nr:hypothetical protein C8J57DRAFT_1643192 [Mycena rebaudengoi]